MTFLELSVFLGFRAYCQCEIDLIIFILVSCKQKKIIYKGQFLVFDLPQLLLCEISCHIATDNIKLMLILHSEVLRG